MPPSLRVLALFLLICPQATLALAQDDRDFGKQIEESIKEVSEANKEHAAYEKQEKERYWKEVEASNEPWKVPEPRPWKPKIARLKAPRAIQGPRADLICPKEAPTEARKLENLDVVYRFGAVFCLMKTGDLKDDLYRVFLGTSADSLYAFAMPGKQLEPIFATMSARGAYRPEDLKGKTFVMDDGDPEREPEAALWALDLCSRRLANPNYHPPTREVIYERLAAAFSSTEASDFSDVDRRSLAAAFDWVFDPQPNGPAKLSRFWFEHMQERVAHLSKDKVTLELDPEVLTATQPSAPMKLTRKVKEHEHATATFVLFPEPWGKSPVHNLRVVFRTDKEYIYEKTAEALIRFQAPDFPALGIDLESVREAFDSKYSWLDAFLSQIDVKSEHKLYCEAIWNADRSLDYIELRSYQGDTQRAVQVKVKPNDMTVVRIEKDETRKLSWMKPVEKKVFR